MATIVLTITSGVLATVGILTTQQVLIEVFATGPTIDRLIAEGTHAELMEHFDPTDRDLFELQAAGYAA